jgi:hypothetical protein
MLSGKLRKGRRNKAKAMQKYPAPFRIQIVYDQLLERSELSGCAITMEELTLDKDMVREFPKFDWDTCRVFVRYEDYSINVGGCLQGGIFQYRANAYHGANPWDQQYVAELGNADAIVEFIIGKFDLVPRSKPISN